MQTARLLEVLLEHRGERADMAQFASAEALLSQKTDFDLYLLDVIMPGMNGIELAWKIRRKQPDAPIVFFTTSADFALESYSVHAVDYIVKPFSREAFDAAIDRAFRHLALVRPQTLMLKSLDGYEEVSLRDLVLAETNGHHTVLQAVNGRSVTLRMSAQELWDRLEGDERFVRVGRQLIVSLAQVKGFAEGTLVLSNGKKVAVPRRSLTEVKSAIARFYGA